MGLTSVLARWASKNVHVLIVAVPGWDESRILLEAELDRRGWRVALSPADADLLAVCGIPGEELRAASDLVWNQLPGPRTRMSVTTSVALPAMLDAAVAHLIDDSRQRADARARSRPVVIENPSPDADEHESMSHQDTDSGAETGAETGTDSGTGTDPGGMHMPMPGGIPLASGGDDRDGLEMDVLNIPLGPILPHWPAGLVVDCVLQGDVIVSAEARVLPPASAPKDVPAKAVTDVAGRRRRISRLCDDASNLLALAGWQAAAQSGRRLRDDALRGADFTDLAAALHRLRRRVERSVLLRWSLEGISLGEIGVGAEAGGDAGAATPNDQAAVDIRYRLINWLREAATLATTSSGTQSTAVGDSDPARAARAARDALAALPELLRGTDLGTARLLIAGLGLDTAALAQTHERTHD